MPEDGRWEFFSCEMDDDNVIVFVRVDIVESAPDASRPWLFLVTLTLKSQRSDGFTDEDETNSLWGIEDRLEREISEAWKGLYVGRYTRAGKRLMIFYLPIDPDPAIARKLVEKCAPSYEFELNSFEDEEWHNYLNTLYPNDIGWMEISNQPVLDNLRERGDPLTPERHTLHWLYFKDRESRDGFLKALGGSTQNFDVARPLDPESGGEQYGACLEHHCSMEKFALLGVQVRLLRLAQEFNGEYDGFECAVVSS